MRRIAVATQQPVSWLNLPVPRERDDDAYFAPLKRLALDPRTSLFLGLIHLIDGIVGAKRRMASADRILAGYGAATECGFGPRPPATVLTLLDRHRAVAEL